MMNPENKITFIDFLKKGVANGGFQNEDIVAICTPLFQEVLTVHEQNKVAPLVGLNHILITNEMLDIDEKFIICYCLSVLKFSKKKRIGFRKIYKSRKCVKKE